jgi:transposase
MKKKETPAKETLEKLHKIERMSLSKIADHFSVSPMLVTNWFKKYNISVDTIRSLRKTVPNKEELETLHYQHKMTRKELAKYFGVERETISKWIKIHDIKTEKYTRHGHLCPPIEELIDLHHNKQYPLQELSIRYKVDWKVVDRWFSQNNIEKRKYNHSVGELEILEFVRSLGIHAEKYNFPNSRKELDIFIPSKKFAIEYNGSFYHSSYFKSIKPKTHLEKYNECLKNEIELLMIFDFEWTYRKQIIQSMIQQRLGIQIKRLEARETTFRQIDLKEARDFLDDHHLQGKTNIILAFGLYYDSELVGVITYSRHHRQNVSKDDIVLSRLCFKRNYSIVGGASKLFKNSRPFLNDATRIISWSDNRWATGNIYPMLGFVLETEYGPDYFYINNKGEIKSKQSMKKDPSKPETEFKQNEAQRLVSRL